MTPSKHHLSLLCCLAMAEASSSNGNGNFMVVSEMTMPLNERGETIHTDVNTKSETSNADNHASNRDVNERSADSTLLNDTSINDARVSHEFQGSGGGGGGSDTDTDGEDEKETSSAPISIPIQSSEPNTNVKTTPERADSNDASTPQSQPLRTLKRLQAMLDDSDYATSAVTSTTTIESHSLDQDAFYPETSNTTPPQQPPQPMHAEPNKLWTRQDRAKYRRTRRHEKQRRDYEQQRALQYREMERQQIVRAERERRELEDLRRKQMEVLELQRREAEKRESMQRQFMEYSDEETETDGGFELPNLPVYLSDGEVTEEEGSDEPISSGQGRNSPNNISQQYSPVARQAAQMHQSQTMQPSRDVIAARNGPSYQYVQPRNSLYSYEQRHQQTHPPPQRQGPPPQFDYNRPPPQQQQSGSYSNYPQQETTQQYQYNKQQQVNDHYHQPQQQQHLFNTNQQQMEEQAAQYAHQYKVWSEAAANGYFYPPPTPPTSYGQQHGEQVNQNQQNHVPPYQAPYYSNANPNPRYAAPPLYGQSYPSFLPQQRATVPESQAGQPITNEHSGNQGFFSRDNHVTQEWLQQQQSSPYDQNGHTPPGAKADANMIDANKVVRQEKVISLVSTDPSALNAEGPYCELKDESAVTISGAESTISFDSIQKLVFTTMGVALLSYCAVSPRSLPFPEYNRQFLQNLLTVGLGALPSLLIMLFIYDGKYNNINTVIGTFHVSFSMGYILAFVSEIVVTTLLRLGVFLLWEPAIFSLTPDVPTIILPWVLREKQYRPKRITLFACDFGASCIASPVIEEYLKLKIVQWTAFLPRNFKPSKKVQKGKRRKKKDILHPIIRDGDEVTNVNCYVSQMMAASLGLKLFDTTRRILMYTKKSDDYKNFYAVCRGLFPIHELCGTMTALLLARRNILGVNTPLWKILGPAVFIHGMANFRGMKPIFKWGSSTPWSEMQLYPWKEGSTFTLKQLLSTSYAKIVWFTILLRVFGYCVKNYYLIGRQAMKRVTTYSGKLYAFSAKLETDAVLKRAKEK